jgi:hypothetical protein
MPCCPFRTKVHDQLLCVEVPRQNPRFSVLAPYAVGASRVHAGQIAEDVLALLAKAPIIARQEREAFCVSVDIERMACEIADRESGRESFSLEFTIQRVRGKGRSRRHAKA